jgi:hypothetical protein
MFFGAFHRLNIPHQIRNILVTLDCSHPRFQLTQTFGNLRKGSAAETVFATKTLPRMRRLDMAVWIASSRAQHQPASQGKLNFAPSLVGSLLGVCPVVITTTTCGSSVFNVFLDAGKFSSGAPRPVTGDNSAF